MLFRKGFIELSLGDEFYIRKNGVAYTPRFGNTQLMSGTVGDVRKHDSPPKGYPKDRNQYAVPETYDFPINDTAHTRAAITYFDKHPWKSREQKREAAKRILRAAKKFGIDVSDKDNVSLAAKAGGTFASVGSGTHVVI